jgi:4-amino-4-deoxy-L-arabinose transferase-like glycosyltransferase
MSWSEERLRWAGWLLPIGLFLIALVLRAWLAGESLPFVEHIDEPAVLEIAIRMVRDGDLNPHTFLYPSLYYNLLAATTKLHVWWGVAAGLYSSDQDIPFKNNGVTAAPMLFVWGRTLTALLGAATVPALYALGRRMFGWRSGLLAALALMLTAYHVRHSHYITVDAPTGLWVTLATLGAWEVAQSGRWRGYVLAGVAAGLAAGTKYNAGVVVAAIGAAHLIQWRWAGFRQPLLRLAASGAVALLAFLATTPFALADIGFFVSQLRFNAYHYNLGDHGDFVGRWPFARYGLFFWEDGLGPVGCLLLLAGLPALARRFPAQVAILLSACLPGMILLLSYATHFTRNMLPVLPLLVLLAAAGLVALVDLLGQQTWRRAALAGLAALLLLPHAIQTYRHLAYWSRPYSMVAASERLRELPQGQRIAAELPPTLFGGATAIFPLERITERDLAWYRANGFRYLAANDELRSEADRAVYGELLANAEVVVVYPPRRAGVQPGPSGAILDLGEHLDQMDFARSGVRFGDAIELLGYEMRPGEPRSRITPLEGANQRELSAGQPVQLNLYWRSLAPTTIDYVLFIHVVDAGGAVVFQRDLPPRAEDYPTSRWQQGELVIDKADLPLPALPPGEYRLLIGLYDPASFAQLPPSTPEPELPAIRVSGDG